MPCARLGGEGATLVASTAILRTNGSRGIRSLLEEFMPYLDRVFGFIQTRLGVPGKTVAGHVSNPDVARRLAGWARAAAGFAAVRTMRLARFGDSMRDVAVTEGDKVETQLRFGVSVSPRLRRRVAEVSM